MTLRGTLGWSLLIAVGCSSPPKDHTFACGTEMCDSATEYCEIIEIPHVDLPDGGLGTEQSASCASQDGGTICGVAGQASAPGQCGCYVSSSGEITVTVCTP